MFFSKNFQVLKSMSFMEKEVKNIPFFYLDIPFVFAVHGDENSKGASCKLCMSLDKIKERRAG
ncbi:hypothetical protein DAMNIGENAA_15050 [Desulforhabdus amnigena]|uniref:Uncharacterized protein n=1 Tax=Desulforhabdus amnigena TaxID=40218 RepID=A0A9W6D0Z2_9BACT|nr:hypothetical protein DAMNIGENAA_15050 [Desulforhabdus amnigena]